MESNKVSLHPRKKTFVQDQDQPVKIEDVRKLKDEIVLLIGKAERMSNQALDFGPVGNVMELRHARALLNDAANRVRNFEALSPWDMMAAETKGGS